VPDTCHVYFVRNDLRVSVINRVTVSHSPHYDFCPPRNARQARKFVRKMLMMSSSAEQLTLDHLTQFYVHVTVLHRNKFLCNKTNQMH